MNCCGKGINLFVSDDEADEEKIKREFESNWEEDNHNIDFNHYIDLSISDGNPS